MKKTPEGLRSEAKTLNDQAIALWKRHDSDGQEHTESELGEFDSLIKRRDALLGEANSLEARQNALNVADLAGTGRTGSPLPHNDPGNTHNGRHGYSLLRALRAMDPSDKMARLDGVELETHQELLKRRHAGGHEVRGVLVPWDLPVDNRAARRFAAANGLERRDLTTTTGAGAVQSPVLPTMIELLRNLSLLGSLGMRVLSDMVGNFSLPRQSGASTVYWINPESSTITGSNQTVDSVAFAPKTVGCHTVYSRSFLSQTGIDAEMFVREDHAISLAIGLDAAGVAGSGSGATPTGIVYSSDVNVVAIDTNGGAPTWAVVNQLEKVVDVANALNGSLAYLTSPAGRYKLKTTLRDATYAGKYLWDDQNQVNSYPAYSTNQVPSNLTKASGSSLSALIFGDYTQAIMAFWGGQDVIVNPYTGDTAGSVRITTLQDADFDLRHPLAFGVVKDMVTT